MGKRGRQRAKASSPVVQMRDRMARVQVSDEVWSAFRLGLGPKPVSVALGELVEREVGRQQRRSASDVESARLALQDARALAQELEQLISRLEPLAGESGEVRDPGAAVPARGRSGQTTLGEL
jgi:hypothetical protein